MEYNSRMNMNLFWGCWCLAFAIGMSCILYFLYFRPRGTEKRCTQKVEGTVIGYAPTNTTQLPKVEYMWEDRPYTVVGPQFEGVVTRVKLFGNANPDGQVTTNLTTRENLPRVLHLTAVRQGVVGLFTSPLEELYPIGSGADVYLNPEDPKEAYVQRFVLLAPRYLFWMTLAGDVVCIVLAIAFFIHI